MIRSRRDELMERLGVCKILQRIEVLEFLVKEMSEEADIDLAMKRYYEKVGKEVCEMQEE